MRTPFICSKAYIPAFMMLLIFLFTTIPVSAQRGDDAERASKNGKTEGTIDTVKVVLEYGRPKVKERVIWGGLVPYDKMWRTGANEATTIFFDKDVTIEGKKLAAGTYALFTIPGKEKWTIIFNKNAKQWGTKSYDEGQDALRIKVTPTSIEHVEEMTFAIEGSKISLHWEKLAVSFAVKAAS